MICRHQLGQACTRLAVVALAAIVVVTVGVLPFTALTRAQPGDPIPPIEETDPDQTPRLEESRIIPSDSDWWAAAIPPVDWNSPYMTVEEQNRLPGGWIRATNDYRDNTGDSHPVYAPDNMFGYDTDAQWIWHESSPIEVWFRYEVPDTPGAVNRVDLWVACDDLATVWVNGHEAGGWGTHGSWSTAAGGADACVALTDLIPYWRDGEMNVIAISGVDERGDRGLLCELRINDADVAPRPWRVPPFDAADPAHARARSACLTLLDVGATVAARDDAEVRLTELGEDALPAFGCDAVVDARFEARRETRERFRDLNKSILHDRLPENAWDMDQVRRFFAEEPWSDRRRRLQVIKRLAVFTAQELEDVIPIWLDSTDTALQADVAYHVGVLGLTGGAINVAGLLRRTALNGEPDTTLALGCLTALWHLAPDLTSGAVPDVELDEITARIQAIRDSYAEDTLVIALMDRVLSRLAQ